MAWIIYSKFGQLFFFFIKYINSGYQKLQRDRTGKKKITDLHYANNIWTKEFPLATLCTPKTSGSTVPPVSITLLRCLQIYQQVQSIMLIQTSILRFDLERNSLHDTIQISYTDTVPGIPTHTSSVELVSRCCKLESLSKIGIQLKHSKTILSNCLC